MEKKFEVSWAMILLNAKQFIIYAMYKIEVMALNFFNSALKKYGKWFFKMFVGTLASRLL